MYVKVMAAVIACILLSGEAYSALATTPATENLSWFKKKKKKSLKNVKFKKDATDYTAPGSLDISYRADNFLSRTVDRQAKPKDSDGSGGSSTHVSSSGTTHGGSSGKF